ncbi:EF-hand domain-containing protein [Pseudoxanthomonas gei]|uniref:EF-hand domain-containing protein n=1 Tax=Pseudoxanthomonas gei TaxID=1383030 RepID=A0ABX0AC66_9GAMM|nr:EF-hand domain-containing protein [Pseudoxanthomonas gei]NDK39169.1 EF-hand domain-containing protein [Pseudoxanthomonas gei]
MTTRKEASRPRFSTRRKALLGLVAIALGVVAWLQYVGAAGISGMATKDMDWNADGSVSQQEIFQSFHSVSVTKTRDGRRQCSSYYWRADRRPIRLDCRTEMEASK